MAPAPSSSSHWATMGCSSVEEVFTGVPAAQESQVFPIPEGEAYSNGQLTNFTPFNGPLESTAPDVAAGDVFPNLLTSGERCVPMYLESTERHAMVKSSYGATDGKLNAWPIPPHDDGAAEPSEGKGTADGCSTDGSVDEGPQVAAFNATEFFLEDDIRGAAEAALEVLDSLVDTNASEALNQLSVDLSERLGEVLPACVYRGPGSALQDVRQGEDSAAQRYLKKTLSMPASTAVRTAPLSELVTKTPQAVEASNDCTHCDADLDPVKGVHAFKRVQSLMDIRRSGESPMPQEDDNLLPTSTSDPLEDHVVPETEAREEPAPEPLWSQLPTDVPVLHEVGGVPSMPKQYCHRAVAEMILAARLTRKSPEGTYTRVAIVGAAGQGKTATATAVAHLQGVLDCFHDCLLWAHVGARGKHDACRLCWVKELYRRVVACLGSPAELLLDGDEYVNATSEDIFVARMNRLMAGHQCLVVFDDIQFPEILNVVAKLNCTALMTMRTMFLDVHFPSCKVFELQALTPTESHRVLFKVVGSHHADHDFHGLVAECKGHPLTLIAAAANWLRKNQSKAGSRQGRRVARNISLPVHSTIREDCAPPALFESLDAVVDGLDAEQRRCYMMLAVLPQGLYAPVPMLQYLWGLGSLEAVQDVVHSLESMYLLHCEHDRHSFEGTAWSLHALQLNHLRSLTESEDLRELMDDAKRRQVEYLSQLPTFAALLELVGRRNLLSFWGQAASPEAMAASFLHVVESWWDPVGENGQANEGDCPTSQQQAQNGQEDIKSPAASAMMDPSTDAPVLVLLRLAAFLMVAEQFATAQQLFLRALVAMKDQKEEDHAKIAMALNSMGTILERKNKFDSAEDFYSRALDMYKGLVGEEHPEAVALMSCMASVIKAQGRFQEAEALHRKALDIRTRMGDSQLDIAESMNSLGMVLSNLGNYEEAVTCHRKVLEIRRRALGQDHPSMAVSMSNLAVVLSAQGNLKEAETLHRKALGLKKKVLGEFHPETAVSMNNLGVLLGDQGNFDEAEALHKRALEISQTAFGEDHPDVAVSLNNLALVMRKAQRNLQEVESLHRRDLEISIKAYGDDHPNVALSLNNLALVLADQQKFKEAEELHRRALEIRRRAFGESHPFVAVSLSNLAGILESRGKLHEAEMLHRRDLEISRRACGDSHPSVACSMNNLAGVLRSQGKLAEAEELHRKDLEISTKTYGDCHPSVAVSLNNLAGVLTDQGCYKEAEEMYLQALDIKRKVYGEKHPNFAITLNSLSSVKRKQGKLAEAEGLSRQSLQIRERAYGDDHPSVLAAQNNLTLALSAQQNLRARKSFVGKVSRSLTKCFGMEPDRVPASPKYRRKATPTSPAKPVD
eukprot:evm.model.scf_129.1 EVM.evm.TU.scf_129.1   scf_129:19156-23235(+)